MEQEIIEVTDKEVFGRFKGASWFPFIFQKDVLVVGAGGIGSWTAFLLGRCGANIHIFDFDQVEALNQAGQLYRGVDRGKLKVDAIKDIIHQFSDPDVLIETYNEKYVEGSMSNDIMVLGLDNMSARKAAWENWLDYLKENPDSKSNSLFIDGRLTMTKLQIFCVKGDDLGAQIKYKENLFDDSEVEELDCTQKQTSFCAAMIGSMMVNFLVNFLTPNASKDMGVPFYTEYFLPLSYFETQNS